MNIKVRYSACDGARINRTFKTLAGARKFAVDYVGKNPEFGSHYAVSDDGVGKVTVEGCTLKALFHDDKPFVDCTELGNLRDEYEAEEDACDEADAIARKMFYDARHKEWTDAENACRPTGCSCSDMQLARVGCECGEELPF